MSPKELIKSILRTRILRIRGFNPEFGLPAGGPEKKYLLLGSDRDLRDFTAFVESTEPVKHTIFLL